MSVEINRQYANSIARRNSERNEESSSMNEENRQWPEIIAMNEYFASKYRPHIEIPKYWRGGERLKLWRLVVMAAEIVTSEIGHCSVGNDKWYGPSALSCYKSSVYKSMGIHVMA